MNRRNRITFSCFIPVLILGNLLFSSQGNPAGSFKVQFGKAGITSLKRANDKYDTEYIARNRVLGHVNVRYKMGENEWRQFSTADTQEQVPAAARRRAGSGVAIQT